MDLVLVLLIGAAVGFSVGIYVARQYGASPKLEIWKREIIRDISSQLSQRSQELNNPDKALIKLSEGLVDKISQKLQEKLQAVQATLEEFKFRLADSQQSLLQDWSRDLLQAISVKLAEHGQQLNNQLAILENRATNQAVSWDSQEVAVVKALEESSQEVIDHISRDKLRLALFLFLWSKGIRIKSLETKEASRVGSKLNSKLNQISNFMGDRYYSIRKLYKSIKSNMNEGEAFSLILKDEPNQVVSDSCQLANMLCSIAFLEEYHYLKSPRSIEAKPSRDPNALNFLSGGWLERYVKEKLVKIASQQGKKISFSYIMNTQVTLPNGNDFEIDLFFYVNDKFYWVESKTGDYHESIDKYSRLASSLGLQQNQAFVVLTDVDQDKKISLSSSYKLSVIGVDDVEPTFIKILKSHVRKST